MFDRKIRFCEFYRFIKQHKQFVYNNKIPHYSCLCEVCENTILFSKGLDKCVNLKKIPTDPRSIVEVYSCDDRKKECAYGECSICEHHGLFEKDFIDEDSSEVSSDESSCDDHDAKQIRVKFYQWRRNDDDYLAKMMTIADLEDALPMWQKHISIMKRHIFTKRH